MTVVTITTPTTLADGEPAVADDSSLAFRQLEGLFQSSVHDENFSKGGALRGQSFRKNALTEVFSRKTVGENWSVLAGKGSYSYDVPGGALRFRLRYPAEVLVFFTASIFRFNKNDKTNVDQSEPAAHYSWVFNALWEGGDSEPGSHYIQARSLLRGQQEEVNRNDVSRSVFLPWKIRPFRDEVPVSLENTRMISATSATGVNSPDEVGRLQAGWHNIRHTVQWADSEDMNERKCAHTMVLGNTELVVIANYGRRADDLIVAQAKKGPVADPFAVPTGGKTAAFPGG